MLGENWGKDFFDFFFFFFFFEGDSRASSNENIASFCSFYPNVLIIGPQFTAL